MTAQKAIQYAKQFIGVKYTSWVPEDGVPKKNCAPFWVDNKSPPPIEEIKNGGMCCVGLANLIRRYMGLQIPGIIEGEINPFKFIGGTENWFYYLKNNNRLKEIDYNEIVPIGTLLLQNYNEIDQGHVAIVIESNKNVLLYSKKIHAIHHTKNKNKYNKVIVETFNDYFYYDRYTHICYPENWLLDN